MGDSALVGKTEAIVGKTETLVGKTETLYDIAQFGVLEHYLVLGLLPRLSRPMSVWPFRRLHEKISYRRSCETEGIVCKGDCVERGLCGRRTVKGNCVKRGLGKGNCVKRELCEKGIVERELCEKGTVLCGKETVCKAD